MPIEWLYLIAINFDCSLDWLIFGKGLKHVATKETEDDNYVYIPFVQGKISAGGGLVPDNNIEMKCAFQREWISRKGNPNRMSLIKVRGDSMITTLLDGDVVLVNHSVATVTVSGGIYAITFNDEIIVKRIEVLFPSGQWEVRSDNPDYKSFVVDPSQVIINGKIIWYARSLER